MLEQETERLDEAAIRASISSESSSNAIRSVSDQCCERVAEMKVIIVSIGVH